MTADISRVDQWIYTTLNKPLVNAQVNNRIYGDMAPQGATFPLILFSYLGGADKVITFSSRFTNAIYLVRAVAKGSSFDAIEALADSLDVLLSNVPANGVTVRDIRIASCAREQPHQRKDMENGIPMVYLGGFYRVRYQPSFV